MGPSRAHCGHLLERQLGCAARTAALPKDRHVMTQHGHVGLQGCHLPALSCHGRLQGTPSGQLTCHCIRLHATHPTLAPSKSPPPNLKQVISVGNTVAWL